jgi:hypothetical protein
MVRGRTFGSQGDWLATPSRHHPDARFGFVFFDIRGVYGISDELGIGRDLRVVHLANASEVVNADGARGGLLSGSNGTGRGYNEQENGKPELHADDSPGKFGMNADERSVARHSRAGLSAKFL